MHKIIMSVFANVAKGIFITLGVPELLSREVRLSWNLMVEYTLIRKTGGGQTFQTEGRAYGKS